MTKHKILIAALAALVALAAFIILMIRVQKRAPEGAGLRFVQGVYYER